MSGDLDWQSPIESTLDNPQSTLDNPLIGNRHSAIRESAIDTRQSAMRRVLLLSHTTGYQLRAFNDAAERLGIGLGFATDRCHRLDDPWQDRAVAVRFHDLDASARAIVARAARD